MYDAEVALLVADLGLDPQLTIEWSFKHKGCLYTRSGEETWGQAAGLWLGHIWHIRVATDLPYREVVDTIAHELRHVWQWETGTLTRGRSWTWKGSSFVPARMWKKLPYEKQPDELDADAYAKDAWQRLFEGRKNPDKVTPQTIVADLFLEALL